MDKESVTKLEKEVENLKKEKEQMKEHQQMMEQMKAEMKKNEQRKEEMERKMKDKMKEQRKDYEQMKEEMEEQMKEKLEEQMKENEKMKEEMEEQMKDNEQMKEEMEEQMKKKMEEQMKENEKMKEEMEEQMKKKMDEQMKEQEQMKKKMEEQMKEHEQMKKKMEEQAKKPLNEREAFRRFVAAVKKSGVTPLYAQHPDIFRIGFLGKVSTGKSSLINALYGSKVAETGRGQTTKEPTLVGEMKLTMVTETKVHIYDIPGDDSDYSYADVKALRLVNSLDLLVVVFDDTISYTFKVLDLAVAFGKHIIFVRNKLDNSGDDELPWQEELEKDKEHLAKMLPTSVPLPLFGVSAKNAFQAVQAALESGHTAAAAPCETYQWNAFMKELINLSEADRDDGTPAGGEVCHNDIRDRPRIGRTRRTLRLPGA